MGLTSGTKLGPYEIQSPLGAGGMGEVYRAKDTRLDRIVAIKVLPAHLSSDPDLKQRLEREAKAISALQHANICTLYDIGTQGGTEFLVMEYLEGQTLADRLGKGALPLEQVLKIGTEVAQALEKAHQHGIIHRDLKPANIMLTKAGAKLMDFGLAKPKVSIASPAIGPFTPSTPTMNLASLTSAASPLTQKGSIVGGFAGSGGRRPQRPVQLRMRSLRNGHRTPRVRRQIATQRLHCHSGKRSGAGHGHAAARAAHARSRSQRVPRQRSRGQNPIRARRGYGSALGLFDRSPTGRSRIFPSARSQPSSLVCRPRGRSCFGNACRIFSAPALHVSSQHSHRHQSPAGRALPP